MSRPHLITAKTFVTLSLALIALVLSPSTALGIEEGMEGGPVVIPPVHEPVVHAPEGNPPRLENWDQAPPPGVITPATRQPTGAMSGRIVFVSMGHGWTANQDNTDLLNGVWYTQRPELFEMIEDMGNHDQGSMYAFYCFNAGAQVVPLRPIGHQPNEVVMDNDSAGVAVMSGTWGNSTTGTPFFDEDLLFDDTNHYRFNAIAAVENAVIRYTPTIPAEGFYPVYAWVLNSSNRVTDQLFRVRHSGGDSEVRIDCIRIGTGWVYLGTYHFEAGTAGYVEISNESGDGTGNVIADGIRFGNGMGDIDRGGGVSGFPREQEAARYWLESQGAPSSTFNGSTTDQNDNVRGPAIHAAAMNSSSVGTREDRIYLSFHSNAGGGQGADGLITNCCGSPTTNQASWADLVATEIHNDMEGLEGEGVLENLWAFSTSDTFTGSFGEIGQTATGNEFDATIIEVAFHDSQDDAELMRDPKVRAAMARASYQATVQYFNTHGTLGSVTLLPEPPTNVRAISNADGTVTVSWDASATDGSGIRGDAATGYVLYRSSNGFGFGNPVVLGNVTSHTLAVSPGTLTHFRVGATNAGGESFPSETVSVRPSGLAGSSILVVNGFDRFGRTQNFRQSGFGRLNSAIAAPANFTIDRVIPRVGNSFDYAVQLADAVRNAGDYPLDSCQNEAVINGQVTLGSYDTVLWILGEESTADESFGGTEQTAVSTFLGAGGNLFLSGAEIAWDLDNLGSGSDQTFINGQLHADYVGDDANTYAVVSSGGNIFAGNSGFSFDDGTNGQYDTDFPDQLGTPAGPNDTGVSVGMTYSGGSGGNAALVYNGTGTTTGKVVFLGFPFETILSAAARDEIMVDVLNFFGTPTVADVPVELSVFTAQ